MTDTNKAKLNIKSPQMLKRIFLSFSFLTLFVSTIASQEATMQVNGRITDAQSGQPLAFVHVIVQDSRQGTMTDIDGFFSLKAPAGSAFLQLSYVGYFSQIYTIDHNESLQKINMHQRPYELQEVVVYPEENPAHRIIRNSINNTKANDPEQQESFSYTSYNKFLATLDQDFYIERWRTSGDANSLRMMEVLDERHVFIMESVTERKFQFPNISNETVMANRVSGLENPMFTMLATELQPFSFYGKSITILENDYLSPLNKAAFNRYFYHLEDTLYQGVDTVFVVGFRPVQNTHFDGLKGLLYINTHGWAVQNVIAQPARDITSGLSFRIQQKYELVDSQHWFPVQLNTDIDFFNPVPGGPTSMVPLRMQGRSYIKNIVINPELSRGDFSNFAVDFDPRANRLPLQFWNKYRPEPLSPREHNTYKFMDSLGLVNNFDRLFNVIEPIIFGEIPFGIFNIPVNSIYRFNEFERHRIGLGLKTNRRFSERVRFGGHYAWASGDKEQKYGYFGELVLDKNYDIHIGGLFSFDVSERGGTSFMQQHFLLSPGLIRNLYINKMDYTRKASAYLGFMAYRSFLTAKLSASRGKTFWTDMYYYTPGVSQPGVRSFRFSEAALHLRFAYGEALINTPTRAIRLPSDYPVFYFNIVKGFDNIDKGSLDYLKMEAAIEIDYSIPFLGKQTWLMEGGWIDHSNLPWPLLFTAKAGNRDYFLASPFSFGTMHRNEFVASRYAAVFFQHNFENLLFRWPGYEPELVLISNIGFGSWETPQNHIFTEASPWKKGYFESGIAIQKIFPKRWVRRVVFGLSPGIEILYRYGPYALPQTRDNITIKLSMITAL